ncbi:pyroglutamyl-peptidase activity protein [Coemansia sp. Benny D115]|nr:pyroglutamyl-peptidase activity protein [Coemansia sp. Benny D115]
MQLLPAKIKYALLTGFEPFGTPRPKDNRSWETIKQLSGQEILLDDETVVHLECHELPVSYSPVADALPSLHLNREFSIVIHCGAGVSGSVKLETLARKKGYSRAGNQGPLDVPECGQVPGYDTNDVLYTEVDVEELKDRLIEEGWTGVCTSADAGRYLCEFTYYISLAEGETTYAKRQLAPPKTLFVHVPPKANDPYDDKELASIVRSIVRHLA